MNKTRQVNNIRIHYSQSYGKWQCKDPDGRILEEFKEKENAVIWAQSTHDFLSKKRI